MFNEELSLVGHIDTLCRAMYNEIKNISSQRRYMTNEVTCQLMVSLILSKLDYCNSLFAGLPQIHLNKLQRVQNCAARVCLRKRKFDHITPILIALRWLPVRERINYKIATLCFRYFDTTLPSYLCNLLKKPPKTRTLRSSNDKTKLFIPIKNMKTYGERSFEYYGPLVWNNIPQHIREKENLETFK